MATALTLGARSTLGARRAEERRRPRHLRLRRPRHLRALFSGQVFHTPYPAQTAFVDEVDTQLIAAAGLPNVDGLPVLSHYSAGVDVEVFPLQRISSASE